MASRTAVSTTRLVRGRLLTKQFTPVTRSCRARFYATSGGAGEATSGSSQAIVGGVAGGFSVLAIGYTWYHFSGLKTASKTIKQTEDYVKQAKEQIRQNAPEPNQAISWLRQTVQSYATLIPGAKGYVDQVFDDVDTIYEKHGEEVDKIVKETYEDLKKISQKQGASIQAVIEGWSTFQSAVQRILRLGKDASQEILERHPQIKEQFGPQIEKLKQLGEQYGPKANEQVNETWKQIQSAVSGGVTAKSLQDVSNILSEKTESVKQMGGGAFQEGMEHIKPLLEKNEGVKKIFENNQESLKNGDMGPLWQMLNEAMSSGGSSGGSGGSGGITQGSSNNSQPNLSSAIPSYLQAIPGVNEISPRFKQLLELGESQGEEVQKVVKSTVEDLRRLLLNKIQEAEDAAGSGKSSSG